MYNVYATYLLSNKHFVLFLGKLKLKTKYYKHVNKILNY